MNKKLSLSLATALLACSANAASVELASGLNASFNAALVSNYIFRGVTLSNDKFAVQAGADLEHDSGVYAGVWASTYKDGSADEVEVDWWAGYAFEINEHLALDVGVTRYYYADVGGHTTEFYIGANTHGLGLGFYYDQTLESYYFEGNYSFDIAENTTLSTHAGYAEPKSGSGAYDLGITAGYALNDYAELFAGAAYHEDEKWAYVVGLAFAF
ncbi:MAG: TorF family putative porin [Ferrimonas sp.]